MKHRRNTASFLTVVVAAMLHSIVSAADSLAELRAVLRADFNADASHIIARTRDGSASLWHTVTGKAVVADLGNGRKCSGHYLSPDKKAALIAFEVGGAQIVDLSTGKPLSPPLEVKVSRSGESRVVFSPDGSTVVVFDVGQRANVFDVKSGKLKTALIPEKARESDDEDSLPHAKFTADGAFCFILDVEGLLVRFDTKTWQPSGKLMKHEGEIPYSFDFDVSEDGKWAAVFDSPGENGPKGSLQMWDVLKGERLGDRIERQNGVYAEFLPKQPGRLMVLGARGDAGVFEVPSGKQQFEIRPHDDVDGPSAMVSPDGKTLLSWGPDRTLVLQDTQSGKVLGTQSTQARVDKVLMAPDSLGCIVAYDNSTFSLQGHYDNYIARVRFIVEEDRIRNLDFDGTIRVLDFVHSIQLSSDGLRLLIQQGGTDRERLQVYSVPTMTVLPAYRSLVPKLKAD
jgi:WD40 repeat protein